MLLIDDLEIDAEISSDHNFDAEVTDHPVEKGANVTDHVRPQPITLTVDGVVSNTPIGGVAERRIASNGLADVFPSDTAYERLQEIFYAREPISIQTARKTYESMVMQSLHVQDSADVGDSLQFKATFKQVQLVTNLRTAVRVAQPRGQRKVNRGNKSTSVFDSPPAQATENVQELSPLLTK